MNLRINHILIDFFSLTWSVMVKISALFYMLSTGCVYVVPGIRF